MDHALAATAALFNELHTALPAWTIGTHEPYSLFLTLPDGTWVKVRACTSQYRVVVLVSKSSLDPQKLGIPVATTRHEDAAAALAQIAELAPSTLPAPSTPPSPCTCGACWWTGNYAGAHFPECPALPLGLRGITDDEHAMLGHVMHFGSEGYGAWVHRGAKGWTWSAAGVSGPPTVWKRKRDAVAHLETFLGILRDALAGRV